MRGLNYLLSCQHGREALLAVHTGVPGTPPRRRRLRQRTKRRCAPGSKLNADGGGRSGSGALRA